MPESYIPENFFKENSFQQKKCLKCGALFWTQEPRQETCGDAPCVDYSFINKNIVGKSYTLPEMRKLFLDYFKNNAHTILKRAPVVPRWREDIYLTIASIAVFQPHVTSGLVEPPANPLVISQPCIRLNDLDAVGKSGRHLSNFEMMAHHAFNTEDKHIYWVEEIVQYCHEFFSEVLHIPSKKISYKEKPWSGGGNAGAALEVLIEGLEVATLVFMDLKESENGEIEIDGTRYTKMPLKIVDTGYGLERMVWLLKGTPAIYQSIYPELLKEIIESSELSFPIVEESYKELLYSHAKISGMYGGSATHTEVRKKIVKRLKNMGFEIDFDTLNSLMEPLEKVYTIADHTKTIALMLNDGIVPSNIKAGYLARLVIRRTLRLLDEVKSESSIKDFVIYHLANYDMLEYDEDNVRRILDILENEEKKYRLTLEKGKALISRFVKGFKKEEKGEVALPLEKLIEFYDSYGIHPSVVEKILQEEGMDFKTPSNFYSVLASRHIKSEQQKEKMGKLSEEEEREINFSKSTKLLYYVDEYLKEFDAHVLYTKGNVVVLDKTAFYPEGGGQPSDRGTLNTENTSVEVVDVQKKGDVVLHILNEEKPDLHVGDHVRGKIDWDRRFRLMQHHTATHILLNAAKRVLGNHIWQAGSQLEEKEARLDISHYKRISQEQIKEIERIANMTVTSTLPVEKSVMNRNDAEKKYGYKLYQGGVPKSNKVRVIRITDYDIQACGGTHCRNTGNVGGIKILRTTNIQDGVERIIFSAGKSAVERIQEMEGWLKDSSRILGVEPSALPSTVKRFFNEWKLYRKKLGELQKKCARIVALKLMGEAEKIGGVKVVVKRMDDSSKEELVFAAEEMTKEDDVIVALGNREGNLVVAASKNLVHKRNFNAAELLKKAAKEMRGGGGGSPFLAMGGGAEKEKVHKALETAKKEVAAFLLK